MNELLENIPFIPMRKNITNVNSPTTAVTPKTTPFNTTLFSSKASQGRESKAKNVEAYVLPDINIHNTSKAKEYTLPHVDLKKYLEKQGHARQTLSTLKQRMHEKEEKIQ